MVGVGIGKGVGKPNPGAIVAGSYASLPRPPAGYRWEKVTAAGENVTANGELVFVLVGA